MSLEERKSYSDGSILLEKKKIWGPMIDTIGQK
jgi:hypothetical protein